MPQSADLQMDFSETVSFELRVFFLDGEIKRSNCLLAETVIAFVLVQLRTRDTLWMLSFPTASPKELPETERLEMFPRFQCSLESVSDDSLHMALPTAPDLPFGLLR